MLFLHSSVSSKSELLNVELSTATVPLQESSAGAGKASSLDYLKLIEGKSWLQYFPAVSTSTSPVHMKQLSSPPAAAAVTSPGSGEARHLSRQAGDEMIGSLSLSMHLLIMGVATLVHSNYNIFKNWPMCCHLWCVLCGEDGAIKLASLMRVTLWSGVHSIDLPEFNYFGSDWHKYMVCHRN